MPALVISRRCFATASWFFRSSSDARYCLSCSSEIKLLFVERLVRGEHETRLAGLRFERGDADFLVE